jgi:enoyl-CoA hydratase/carnithine racemase
VLVAAVRGAAVSVGTTMLLHCDFVAAARSGRLSLPFVTFGLVCRRQPARFCCRGLIGHLRATELMLLRWGLVNCVVEEQPDWRSSEARYPCVDVVSFMMICPGDWVDEIRAVSGLAWLPRT